MVGATLTSFSPYLIARLVAISPLSSSSPALTNHSYCNSSTSLPLRLYIIIRHITCILSLLYLSRIMAEKSGVEGADFAYILRYEHMMCAYVCYQFYTSSTFIPLSTLSYYIVHILYKYRISRRSLWSGWPI